MSSIIEIYSVKEISRGIRIQYLSKTVIMIFKIALTCQRCKMRWEALIDHRLTFSIIKMIIGAQKDKKSLKIVSCNKQQA
jgi:hypothetical protein